MAKPSNVNVILWFLLFSFQYGDAAIHTAVRHDHVHLLPYLLGQSFQSVLLPTRNGSHKEVEHVNLQNEVSAIKAPLSIYFESTKTLFIPFTQRQFGYGVFILGGRSKLVSYMAKHKRKSLCEQTWRLFLEKHQNLTQN